MSKTVSKAARPLAQRLRPLSEVVAELERSLERQIAWWHEQTAKNIRLVETNRRAFAMLDCAGFAIDPPHWEAGSGPYTLALGYFPPTKRGNAKLAAQVRKLRLALDTPLGTPAQDASAKQPKTGRPRVEFTYSPAEFPGLRVTFERHLPRGGKCRIVRKRHTSTSTYTRMVCKT